MEEKTEITERKLEVQKNYLDSIFNPAQFKISYPSEPTETDFLNEEKKVYEQDTYNEIVNGLESDLTNLGMEITYSARIIIREVAMNLLFLQRVKAHMLCKDLLVEKRLLKKNHISSEKNYDYSSKKTTSTWNFYDYFPSNNHSIHPLFEKLVPQLQKQIHDGLKDLALLPCQQIERQKLTIVKKLKERFTALNGSEITIEAKAEKEIIRNKKEGTMPQEQINIENLT